MEIDVNNELIELDGNPSKLISNLLKNCNEVESLTLLINHIAPRLDENTTILFLHKIQLDIFKMLKDEYLIIATKPYPIAKNACNDALDNIYKELHTRTFFRTYIDNPEIRRALIYCLTLAALADISQEHEKYTLGLMPVS